MFTRIGIGLLTLLLSPAIALAQELDTDYNLKPLVDSNREAPARQPQGAPQNSKHVITGSVKTLKEAIEAERDTVDWYAWYMTARQYIAATGGLPCPLDASIKFHKNGRMEALSQNPECILMVRWRNFPLPRETRLDAIILPVRPSEAPPASRDEIRYRINAQEKSARQ